MPRLLIALLTLSVATSFGNEAAEFAKLELSDTYGTAKKLGDLQGSKFTIVAFLGLSLIHI